jgi:hypothetical protein
MALTIKRAESARVYTAAALLDMPAGTAAIDKDGDVVIVVDMFPLGTPSRVLVTLQNGDATVYSDAHEYEPYALRNIEVTVAAR